MRLPPPKLFTVNPSRGVFITQDIDHSLYKDLFPQILKLRQTPDPICLFLESRGGNTFFADLIANMIKCPDQYGKQFHLITVGSGFVASCAADLLALGDYAVIYPFAHVHYHGTRQQADDITLQQIPFLVGSLRTTNEQYALRLAGKMFRRMTFLVIELALAAQAEDASLPDHTPAFFDVSKIDEKMGNFEQRLRTELDVLNSETGLLDEAFKKRQKFKDLIATLSAFEKAGKGINVKDQSALFKYLLDMEMAAHTSASLTELLPIVEDDFQQVRDFFFGKYQRDLHAIITESGLSFLTPSEVKKWNEEPTAEAKNKWILKTVSPRLEPLWLLAVSVARTLQEGEFPMSPEEAYWLGLVDEVISSGLPCLRERAEQMAEMALKSQQQNANQK